ncbi:MAG: sigma-70 family RNA polymerase sigma factor [Salinibacter sp.]
MAGPHVKPQSGTSSTGEVSQIKTSGDFSAVFRSLYEPLVRYARGLTSKDVSARDVVQEVFTTLWEDRSGIVVESSLEALLYTMVRNRVLNANRNERNRAESVSPQDMGNQEIAGRGADETLSAKHLRRCLSAWIDDLPPRRREAFVLSRHHGL